MGSKSYAILLSGAYGIDNVNENGDDKYWSSNEGDIHHA